jgi:hypothetical protein
LYRTDIPAGPTAGPARLTPIYGGSWPQTQDVINAFTVRFTAGYGTTAASVPYDVKAAIKLLIGHLYENREAVIVGSNVTANGSLKVSGASITFSALPTSTNGLSTGRLWSSNNVLVVMP